MTLGVHLPGTAYASPSPGHGGIVTATAASGSAPTVIRLGASPHLAVSLKEKPYLLDGAMGDRHRGMAGRQGKVRHAAALEAEQDADIGTVGRDHIAFRRKPLGAEPHDARPFHGPTDGSQINVCLQAQHRMRSPFRGFASGAPRSTGRRSHTPGAIWR
ncbi:MAG: hypothetical protein NTZ05_19425 [Chloroflexi bacterium]|nr:hypothetical protein [Chloroflexota bacterium]